MSKTKKFKETALVLQGGGALGSYQAGAFEGLAQNGVNPTWVVGISIGALNTAIIAGNPPEKRVEQLHAFWDTICSSTSSLSMPTYLFADFINHLSELSRKVVNTYEAHRTIMHGQKGFFAPKFLSMMPFNSLESGMPDKVSYYDTSDLKETLLKFADFDLINKGDVRVSVGAVNVRTSELVYFDNAKEVLTPEHFMASGALPPSFPAIKIGEEYYWDGGLVSNTPVIEVIKQNRHKDMQVYQIDLWPQENKLPKTFDEIKERIKDVQFSSRTSQIEEVVSENKEYAAILQELLQYVPAEKKNSAMIKRAKELAKVGELDIKSITYQNKPYEGSSKDYEFSVATMNEHWKSGYEDVQNIVPKTHPKP